jgi:hypothetical protein
MKPVILAASPWVQNHSTSMRRVVLRSWNTYTPYVVHTEYRETGSETSVFETGDYHTSRKPAWESFITRSTRQMDEPILWLPV